MNNTMLKNQWMWLLAAVLTVLYVPWLGETLFNTKGEPREAIVALSMVESGNYVLPVSMGADIAYKPPMLAWLIVAASWLTGGVNEMASRLPSALACIAMCLSTAAFVARRRGVATGVVTALVTATSFEVFRAAGACRVDMLLSCMVVMAILAIMGRRDRLGKPGLSWTAVALMSVAVLTKGPVGMLLPCLVAGVVMLVKGDRPVAVAGWLALAGALSLIAPAAWYVAAWQRGGQVFLDLAMEENLGRFMGRMSYSSHENPFYYNFITLAAGMAPYTLLALMAAAVASRRWGRAKALLSLRWWRSLDEATLVALVTTVVVVAFYTIPKSKRSVYLLPVYPFVSYFVALMIRWLVANKPTVVRVYATIIGVLTVLPSLVGLILAVAPLETLTAGMKAETARYVAAIGGAAAGWFDKFLVVAVAAVGVDLLVVAWQRRVATSHVVAMMLASTLALYVALSAVFFPAVLNTKSDRHLVGTIEAAAAGERVYMWLDDPMLRYYTINFYMNDSLRLLERPAGSATLQDDATGQGAPREGYLLVGERDLEKFKAGHGDVELEEVMRSPARSCDTRQVVTLQRFKR